MYDFNQYQTHILAHAKALPLLTDLQHAGLGHLSEVGEICDALKAHMIYDKELDRLNIVEECGDGLWFSALYAKLLGFNFHEIVTVAYQGDKPAQAERVISYAFHAIDAASAMAAAVAAHVDEGEPLWLPRLSNELGRYVRYIRYIGRVYSVTLDTIAEVNKTKLDYRYGGNTFSAEKGLNRNKEGERAAMRAVLDAADHPVVAVAA